MKSLTHYIQEKLVIKKKSNQYKYFPQTKEELKKIIEKRIKDGGNEVDLNDIDVSKITNMSSLFVGTDFNGDISNWNTSNVNDMSFIFYDCESFNQDISQWNVSNVIDMYAVFSGCKLFNQDISTWDVSNVENMNFMFFDCKSFNQDISQWDVSNVKDSLHIFKNCSLKDKYKPKFK